MRAAKPAPVLFRVDSTNGSDSAVVTCKDAPYHCYRVREKGVVVWSPLASGHDGGEVEVRDGRVVGCTCKGWKYRSKCKHTTGTRALALCGDIVLS